VAAKSDVFVLTEEQRHELMDLNREWLDTVRPHPPALPSGKQTNDTARSD
jgi:hypothetical protein